MPQAPDSTNSKAEQAAAARKAQRAVQEAQALRKNLLKRKAQTRERTRPDQAAPYSEGAK